VESAAAAVIVAVAAVVVTLKCSSGVADYAMMYRPGSKITV
jgi:hypothetical protein